MVSVKRDQVNAAYYIKLGHKYFLHILSNSLVTDHLKIQHKMLWAPDTKIK